MGADRRAVQALALHDPRQCATCGSDADSTSVIVRWQSMVSSGSTVFGSFRRSFARSGSILSTPSETPERPASSSRTPCGRAVRFTAETTTVTETAGDEHDDNRHSESRPCQGSARSYMSWALLHSRAVRIEPRCTMSTLFAHNLIVAPVGAAWKEIRSGP
jgi:hypothetical protein